MYNLYTHIANNPARCRRFTCGESLIALYNCRLTDKYVDLWSHNNYVVFVTEGRKIWHTPHGSYDLRESNCVFIRKGASIVEQFSGTEFCFLLFFIPDEFICEVLRSRSVPISKSGRKYEAVIPIDNNAPVKLFFQAMMLFFEASREPDPSLLQLKFRELILTIADNPVNSEILSWFGSLLQEPQTITLQRVMDDNFCFNLKLEEYAKLSSRSLSAFKRDFVRIYNTTPGKWLMEKRLNYALHLLGNLGKTVAETAFESGFENASHFSRSFRQRFGVSAVSVKQQNAVRSVSQISEPLRHELV